MNDRLKGRIWYVKIDDLTRPRDGICYVDRWWTVDPVTASAVIYQSPGSRGWSPQCNPDQRIAESLTERLYPGHVARLIPVAYLGHIEA